MLPFDVVVVGGGPAGAVTARTAAERGARVLLLERRTRIVEPSACGGLVSLRTLAVLGASERSITRRVCRAALHAPGGATLALHATSDRAIVLDRSILELELLERARESGVEVRLGAEAIAWADGAIRFLTPSGEDAAQCSVLVGADGPESRVAAWAGLRHSAPCLRAAQAEIDVSPDVDVVGVYVGRQVAPGFFAWSIPAQPGRLRVGVAAPAPGDPVPLLDRLLATRFPEAPVAARIAAPIPLPDVEAGIVRGEILLVGDAAGHVKPLSGGGLYFGGLCARIAGRAAAEAARNPEGRGGVLRHYEETCRRLLGAETRFGATASAARNALEDQDWDSLIALLARSDLVALVEQHVDLDHLRSLAARLMSHPRLWPTLFEAWGLVGVRLKSVADLDRALL